MPQITPTVGRPVWFFQPSGVEYTGPLAGWIIATNPHGDCDVAAFLTNGLVACHRRVPLLSQSDEVPKGRFCALRGLEIVDEIVPAVPEVPATGDQPAVPAVPESTRKVLQAIERFENDRPANVVELSFSKHATVVTEFITMATDRLNELNERIKYFESLLPDDRKPPATEEVTQPLEPEGAIHGKNEDSAHQQ